MKKIQKNMSNVFNENQIVLELFENILNERANFLTKLKRRNLISKKFQLFLFLKTDTTVYEQNYQVLEQI